MAQFRQSIVGAGSGGSKKKKEEVLQNVQNQQEKSGYVPEPVVPTQQPVVPTQQPVVSTQPAVVQAQQPTASSQQPVATQQTAATTQQTTTPVQQTITLPKYEPSEAVLQAQAMLQQQMASHPGEYTSLWQDQIAQQVNQILSRDPFSYDVYADPAYQQFADQYTRMGKLASMDAMGQAAALTGGYGSSYGQSVGNQAYFNYLNQLNNVVPELEANARNNYELEGQAMKDNLSLLTAMEDQEYSRYNDSLNKWLTERNYLTDRYETERATDYERYMDQLNMDYQLSRDAIDDARYEQERADELASARTAVANGSGNSKDEKTGITYNQMLELDEKAKTWAKQGKEYLNLQLSYWVTQYGLDKDYAADLLMYYFPIEEDPQPSDVNDTNTKNQTGIGARYDIRPNAKK